MAHTLADSVQPGRPVLYPPLHFHMGGINLWLCWPISYNYFDYSALNICSPNFRFIPFA